MVSLWRNSDFLKLWTGQTVSELGSRITRDGLPWAAVLVLGATPSEMGILSSLGSASVLAFGLVAGVWADRMPKRPTLIATDLARAALLATIPLAAVWQRLAMPQLYLVAAAAGVLTVFFDVAYQSYLPFLVQPGELVEANTKLMFSSTGSEIVGPGAAGILVQWITAPLAIMVDAASFLFSAFTLFLIREPGSAAPQIAASEPRQIWRDSLAGLHFVWGDPILRALGLRAMVAYLSGGFIMPLFTLYAIQSLHLAPAALGLTIAIGGASGMLGAMLSSRIVGRFGLGPAFIGAAVCQGVSMCLIPGAHGSPAVAIAFLAGAQLLGDSATAVYIINENSLRQRVTPPEMLGRVNAAMQLATRGMLPLGALTSGFLAEAIGVRTVLAIGAAGFLLSIACLLFSPIRTLRYNESCLLMPHTSSPST